MKYHGLKVLHEKRLSEMHPLAQERKFVSILLRAAYVTKPMRAEFSAEYGWNHGSAVPGWAVLSYFFIKGDCYENF